MRWISHSTVDEIPWLLHGVVIGALILWLYTKVSGAQDGFLDSSVREQPASRSARRRCICSCGRGLNRSG